MQRCSANSLLEEKKEKKKKKLQTTETVRLQRFESKVEKQNGCVRLARSGTFNRTSGRFPEKLRMKGVACHREVRRRPAKRARPSRN